MEKANYQRKLFLLQLLISMLYNHGPNLLYSPH